MTHRGMLVGVAVLALTGCGQDPSGQNSDRDDPVGTSLDIIVTASEGGEPKAMTLTCDPAGGDHPNAEAACAKLAAAAPAIFDPVPADQICTMIFGGPQTAEIRGSYDGEKVDASFSRSNGCEIGRWDALGTEVFDVPLQ